MGSLIFSSGLRAGEGKIRSAKLFDGMAADMPNDVRHRCICSFVPGYPREIDSLTDCR